MCVCVYVCMCIYVCMRVCAYMYAGNRTVVLAYNLGSRERMVLSTSTDGGVTWQLFATLDHGKEPGQTSDTYPTVIASGSELLTVWSTYDGGPANANTNTNSNSNPNSRGFANIKLARTRLPGPAN